MDFDLLEAVNKSARIQPIEVSEQVQKQILDFITGRLNVLLKDLGHRFDAVDAVLAEQSANPSAAAKAVRQLESWVRREDWNTILPGFARCVRITRDQEQVFQVAEKALVEKEEKELFKALQQAESASRQKGSVDDFLNAFVPMIPAVNAFFDKVLVMAEDKVVKENRLGLLQRIAALSSGAADPSRLEGF